MTSRRDYDRTLRAVKAVINSWDPYRLLANGMPTDEFEPEIRDLVALIPRIRTQADTVNAISKVFSKWFEDETFGPEYCMDVGEELYLVLVREGIIAVGPSNAGVPPTASGRG